MNYPKHKFRVPDEVAELIRRMHPHLRKKIKASLQTILSDADAGKTLRDELAGLRSFRVSRFRIIYRISRKNVIEIIAIGPRKRIYEETFLILNKKSGKRE
ncbi:MAG TPA: cytotoxin [Nitrospirae bacterium]|nr:cytotoxin [Nitrospirota bacterium]